MKIGTIQKDVQIPEVHSKIKYPWPEMNVGDSVLIQAEKGEMNIQLVINSKGNVIKVKIIASQLTNRAVEKCVISEIKKMHFPAPKGSDKAVATVTLVFSQQ